MASASAADFALSTASLKGIAKGSPVGGRGEASLLLAPFTSFVLSTSANAPSASFGTAPRRTPRGGANEGPGPGAYATTAGLLSTVGHSDGLLLADRGAPAFSFGGDKVLTHIRIFC